MNKENSLWLRFQVFFLFVDLKVILLIVMLFNFYKETALLAEIVGQKQKESIAHVLNVTWQNAGSGFVKWIIAAIVFDIVLKKILESMND